MTSPSVAVGERERLIAEIDRTVQDLDQGESSFATLAALFVRCRAALDTREIGCAQCYTEGYEAALEASHAPVPREPLPGVPAARSGATLLRDGPHDCRAGAKVSGPCSHCGRDDCPWGAPAPRAATPEPDAEDALVAELRGAYSTAFPRSLARRAADMIESLAADLAESRREVERMRQTLADIAEHADWSTVARNMRTLSAMHGSLLTIKDLADAAIDAAKGAAPPSSAAPEEKK